MEEFLSIRSTPYAALAITTPLLVAVDTAWGHIEHWSISWHGEVIAIIIALGSLMPLLFKRYRQDEKVKCVLISCSLFILFSLAASFFDYLLVTTDSPLIDNTLAAWDHRLGFNWPALYLWTKQNPYMDYTLALAYASVFTQIFVVFVYLSFTRRYQRLAEFNTLLVVSFLFTSLISVYFPAEGPGKFYQEIVHADVSFLSHFEPLRNGSLRIFDVRAAQGLVSIPSFHIIMAILLTYAMRHTRIYPAFILLNILVAISTPIRGEHYLVDLVGGALTAIVIIGAIQLLKRHASLHPKVPPQRLAVFDRADT